MECNKWEKECDQERANGGYENVRHFKPFARKPDIKQNWTGSCLFASIECKAKGGTEICPAFLSKYDKIKIEK